MKPTKQNQEASLNAGSDALSKMDELIKRRGEINQCIGDITKEIEDHFKKQNTLKSSMAGLKNDLLEIPVKGIPERDQQYYADKKQGLNDKLLQKEQEFEQAEVGYKKLNEKLIQLQTIELPACMVAICAEGVMEHQQRVKQATIAVNNIKAVIDSQNQFISKTRAAIPQMRNRQQERGNLLAEIALGNGVDDDLKNLDAAIAIDQESVNKATKDAGLLIENALATVSSLECKLDEAQAELNVLESITNEVNHRYFLGEAEKVATQYVNHALHLKELHQRLMGLNFVMYQYDQRGFVVPGAGEIKIPMYRLPQFEGFGNPGIGDWMMFDGERVANDQVTRAANAEKSRFDAILSGHYYSI